MPGDWRAHRTLRSAERRALSWIRGAIEEAVSHTSTEAKAARLTELLAACGSSRPAFLTSGSPYASPGERAFISQVAEFQREASNARDLPDDPITQLAAWLAGQLWEAEIRLPISAGSEVMDFKRYTALRAPTTASAAALQNGTAKLRVFELLTSKGAAYRHELLGLGISRQYLGALIRSGFLIQSGRAIYRLAKTADE